MVNFVHHFMRVLCQKGLLLHPAVLAGCCALVLCAASESGQARSLMDIKKSRELRICIAPGNPGNASVEPPDCRGTCKLFGPVYEQALEFAKSLGKGVVPKVLSVGWDEQFFNRDGKTVREAVYTPELLASGKCDFYPSNLTKNEWREKKLDFVVQFPNRQMVVVARPMKTHIKRAADLAGKTAAVAKDTSSHTWLQEENQTAYAAAPVVLKMVEPKDIWPAVDDAAVDFTVRDSYSALWATKHQLKNALVGFPVGPKDEIGWAFRKEDKDLQEMVQKWFEHQSKSEVSPVNQIWAKHYGISLNKFVELLQSTP